MHGPEAGGGMTTVPATAVALDSGVPDQRRAPGSDLVTLHESIARLLAVQGNWKRAYSHLNAALRLARDSECAMPIIPEQYRRQVAELRRAHAEAVDASLRDALTASYNRRYLDQTLDDLIAEHTHGGDGIAVALVDLDLFKQVNDKHGHLLGDRVLRQVVRLLQESLPPGAFCARYGGEEFALVLPGMSAREAVATLERARVLVAEYPWHTLAPQLRVTISSGLVHLAPDPLGVPLPRLDPDEPIRLADEALYAAKRAGRNAVGYRLGGAIRIAGLDDSCR
jgi:two-component system cell cycle response regulator